MKRFYVYAVYEVIDESEVPIYVGKGHDDTENGYSRLAHYSGDFRHVTRAVRERVCAITNSGGVWGVKKLVELGSELEAFAAERHFIAKFGRRYLVNCTDGGSSGWVLRPESRERMSLARRGKKLGPISEEHRAKLKAAAAIRAADPKWRQAHSMRMKGCAVSSNTVAAAKAALTGKPHANRATKAAQSAELVESQKAVLAPLAHLSVRDIFLRVKSELDITHISALYRALHRCGLRSDKLALTEEEKRRNRLETYSRSYRKHRSERIAKASIKKAQRASRSNLAEWLSLLQVSFVESSGIYRIDGVPVALTLQPLTRIADRTTPRRFEALNLFQRYAESGAHLMFVDPGTLNSGNPSLDHWLRHKLGRADRLCHARLCTFGPVDGHESTLFYDRYHLQGGVGGIHFGLLFEGRLVACMSFSKSAPERKKTLHEGAYNLVRFAAAGSVPGAASKLFTNAVKALSAASVVTYSDNRYAAGGVYSVLGFAREAVIEPDYRVWHPKIGIRHKSYWQRRVLPKRIAETGVDTVFDPETDIRTEFDIEELCGCLHAWDCGKTRWMWSRELR